MNVCVFSCGKKLWILTPGVSGRVWAPGSGSGFCLRVLNILIFVFRSEISPDRANKQTGSGTGQIDQEKTNIASPKEISGPGTRNRYFWRNIRNFREEKIRGRMFGKLIRNIIIIIIRKTMANYETGFHSDSLICYTWDHCESWFWLQFFKVRHLIYISIYLKLSL